MFAANESSPIDSCGVDDLSAEEKNVDFDRWKPFLSLSSHRLPYADIAAEFGMTEGAARVAVHRLR